MRTTGRIPCAKKSGTKIELNGQKMQMYTKKGMHVENCDVKQLTQYLLTVDESCAYEVKLFVLRIFQIRFPAEFERSGASVPHPCWPTRWS